MKNNKSAMLALLMLAVSAFVMAAEPHHDAHEAHDKPAADAHAKADAVVPAAAVKPDEAAPPAVTTVAKPSFKKKKARISKAPLPHNNAAHAANVRQSPAQTTAQTAAQTAASHADAHSHAEPAAPLVAVDTVDKAGRPRNRIAIAADSHAAPVVSAVHAESPAPAHSDAKTDAMPDTKPEAHAEAVTETVKKIPVVEAVAAVETPNNAAALESASSCNLPSKTEIAALFDRWNASLKTGDAKKIVANYATPSILLPTVSNQARFTAAEKEDYFVHFLQRKPEGKIDDRFIEVDCNSATDAGLYSFKFGDGSVVKARYSFSYRKVDDTWLISSHHSSAMPEKAAVASTQDNHAGPAIALERNDVAPRNSGWIRFP